jgi:zinc protease
VGWRGPGANDPEAAVGAVIARLLAGATDTRLPAALQSGESPVLSVQAGWDSRRDASFLWAAAAPRVEADSAQVERDLLTAVRRLASKAPDGAELDQARKRVIVPMLFGMQSPRGRANALGEAVWLNGDPAAAQQRIAAVRRVTPEDVRRFAERLLRDDAQAVVWLRGTTPATEDRP